MAFDLGNGIRPGDPGGNALLNAHTWPDGSALGNKLLAGLHPGDALVVQGDAGQICYHVTDRIEVPATAQHSGYFDTDGPPRIAIAVCSGQRVGPGHWTKRTLWFASPTEPPAPPEPPRRPDRRPEPDWDRDARLTPELTLRQRPDGPPRWIVTRRQGTRPPGPASVGPTCCSAPGPVLGAGLGRPTTPPARVPPGPEVPAWAVPFSVPPPPPGAWVGVVDVPPPPPPPPPALWPVLAVVPADPLPPPLDSTLWTPIANQTVATTPAVTTTALDGLRT